MAHEIGHVLGLGHSESNAALMYYDISSKQHLNLSQDDIDGLTWLNPREEPGSGFMGCGTISVIGAGAAATSNSAAAKLLETKFPPRNPPSSSANSGATPSVIATWFALVLFAYVVSREKFFKFFWN